MFVIYKENLINGVGGIHPTGIKAAIAEVDGWYLAEVDEKYFHKYKEYDFISIPAKIADGMKLIDSIPAIETEETPTNDILINFSIPEKKNINDTKVFINNINNKLITRAKIREQKDLEDDFVDMKRLIQSLLVFVMDDWEVKTQEEQDTFEYKDIMSTIKTAIIDDYEYIHSFDKNLDKVLSILDSEAQISQIVNDYYLTKKQ